MNFKSPFSKVLPLSSKPGLVSSLSPDGHRLATCARPTASVLLVNVESGLSLGHLQFDCRITCLFWATNSTLILGSANGQVFQANVAPNPRLDPSDLALMSTILTSSNGAVKALCYDPIHSLLAVGFIEEVQILSLRLDAGRRRRWVLFDQFDCPHPGMPWLPSAMEFYGSTDRFLFISSATKGFTVWAYKDKSISWFQGDDESAAGPCAISPDNQSLAVSFCSDTHFGISIWPLSTTGPIMEREKSYKIPTGQVWIEWAEFAPLAFLDSKLVITADPVGTIYIVSVDGQTKHTFSVGVNYFVRSIMVCQSMVNIVAIGPASTTMLLQYTDDAAAYRKAVDIRGAHINTEDLNFLFQNVTKSLRPPNRPNKDQVLPEARRNCSPFAFMRSTFVNLLSHLSLKNVLISMLILFINNKLNFDLLTAYNVFYITAQVACAEFIMYSVFRLLLFMVRLTYGVFGLTTTAVITLTFAAVLRSLFD
ncbi:hypothetical protein FRC08_017025 [Ceratobasidium sp. 394]|nr:hypothetical protein FRC08_017025 [Ceratobasidium sp. 394]